MADPQSQTSLVEQMADEAGDEASKSFWRSFGQAFRKAAVATGRGTAWLARTGYDNRNYVPAVINGAIGDRLAESGDRMAIQMSLREAGRDVRPDDFEPLTGHVAVFAHGLMADEAYWTRPFGDFEGLGPVLARERDLTPLYVRYNSGLHVSQNGQTMAGLLEDLVETHPGIDRLTLVGHSMGGLVMRSAAHYASPNHAWKRRVDSVVLLGSPNDGSYMEQVAHLSSWVLEAIPTIATNIIARTIKGRSNGIKDMRLGLLVSEDWQRADAATMGLKDRTEVPLMPGVHYHVAIGTITESADSILAAYFGDGIVGRKSALAAEKNEGGASISSRVFTKTSHTALVSSPEVQEFVSDALAVKKLLDR